LRGFILFFLLNALVVWNSNVHAQEQMQFKGRVLAESGRALEFASIYVKELDLTTFSSEKGDFSISYPASLKQFQIRITSVGKLSVEQQVTLPVAAPTIFRLKELTLTLKEVTVNPMFRDISKSNSSIIFDEEAIERVQAFSLIDILNTIPGRATVAPNINAPQTITLRGNLGGNYDLNNSLGIPIIIDGVTQSNDANMQSRSVSQFGMAGSILGGANATNASDVPFQGMDLRDIPVETIEKVEVIQGVASAEYGEMTDGAILVDRKAGAGPYQFTTSINGGSTNYSIGKGFKLPQQWGAVNLGLNYAISNPDPRDKVKQYARVATSLIWSKNFSKDLKNTFSFDYNRRSDDIKMDPDDGQMQKSFSKNSGIRISNRFNLKLNTALAKQLNITASYSESNQHTFKQWLINRGPVGYTNKDTTGIYEGIFSGGRVLTEEEIIGHPVTASAGLRFNTFFQLAGMTHAISYGANYNYSNNGGKGIISDPYKPRWIDAYGQNARAYSFESVDAMQNVGLFLTDNFSFHFFGKRVNSNFGLRYDQQNGIGNLQPRLSSRIVLDKRWDLNLAFGVSTKSPTLAHRYPAPTYLDIPLILAVNANDALYLVYTQKYQADNSHLKPSRATQAEIGLSYNGGFINSRLNMYYKSNRNGFRSVQQFREITLPVFEYRYDETSRQIVYNETGAMQTFHNYSDNSIQNAVSSNTYGFDWLVSTRNIPAINTSLTASTSFILGDEDSRYLTMDKLASPLTINGQNIWYLLFQPNSDDTKYKVTSKLSTNTHVPKLGFVVSTMLDVFWLSRTKGMGEAVIYAKGYVDTQGRQVLFEKGEQLEGASKVREISSFEQPMAYANFNISVAKEIKKNLRISIAAYNVFDIRPEYTTVNPTNNIETTVIYNSPVSLTGSISIKF